MFFIGKCILLFTILFIFTAPTFQSEKKRCKQLRCNVCEGESNSTCSKDLKSKKLPSVVQNETCNLDLFPTSVVMCGTQKYKDPKTNATMVRRGCFPGTGEVTCFKNHLGFQCLCDDCLCNNGEVKKTNKETEF